LDFEQKWATITLIAVTHCYLQKSQQIMRQVTPSY